MPFKKRSAIVKYGGLLISATMEDTNTLGDVSHTPPHGEAVSNVWERGGEVHGEVDGRSDD